MTDEERERDGTDDAAERDRGAAGTPLEERTADTAREVAEQARKMATEATRKLASRAPDRVAKRLGGDDEPDGPPDVPDPEPRKDRGKGKCPKCEERALYPMKRRPGYICTECDKKFSPQSLRAAQIGY